MKQTEPQNVQTNEHGNCSINESNNSSECSGESQLKQTAPQPKTGNSDSDNRSLGRKQKKQPEKAPPGSQIDTDEQGMESYPDAQQVDSDNQTDFVMLDSSSTAKRKRDQGDSFAVPESPRPQRARSRSVTKRAKDRSTPSPSPDRASPLDATLSTRLRYRDKSLGSQGGQKPAWH